MWDLSGPGQRNNLLATPVLYKNRIYVGTGQHPSDGGEDIGRLCCIDATKTGDISIELAVGRRRHEWSRSLLRRRDREKELVLRLAGTELQQPFDRRCQSERMMCRGTIYCWQVARK